MAHYTDWPEYPTDLLDLVDYPTQIDDIDDVMAWNVNALVHEMIAVQKELGTLPKGAFADVKTRLGAGGTKIMDADGDTKVDTEESADEDQVRMDVKGVEAFHLHNSGILDLAKQSRCGATLSSSQTIGTSSFTKASLATEEYDEQNELDSTTLYRFTATEPGTYMTIGKLGWENITADKAYYIAIWKNGAQYKRQELHSSHVGWIGNIVVANIELAANDYLEMWVWQNSGVNRTLYAGKDYTYLEIIKMT